MRVADRYIGWQIFIGTILGVTMLTLVLVLSQVFKEIRDLLVARGAPIEVLVHFVLLILPSTLMFTLPWGFLVSTLLSFGRLSSNNELISLRMAGLSLRRIAMPVVILGIGFSCVCYYINSTISPAAQGKSKNLVTDLVMENPRAFLQPGVVQSRLKDQRVYIEQKNEDETLSGFHVYLLSNDPEVDQPTGYIHAGKVDLTHEAGASQLSLVLNEVFLETTKKDGTVRPLFASEAKPWFFDLSGLSKKRIKPYYLTNKEIPGALEALDTKIAELDGKLQDPALSPSQREIHTREREKSLELSEGIAVEPHKRLSLSMACFAFSIIGIPLGISARRKETSSGLMLSLLIAAIYFGSLLSIKQSLGVSREVLIALFWLPNVLCIGLGIWLFQRASYR